MIHTLNRWTATALSILAVGAAPALAQTPVPEGNIQIKTPPSPIKEKEDTSKKKVLREIADEDGARWRKIGDVQLTPDGEWFAYKA